MLQQPVILLSCGSFNPPTNMHFRIFELARDHLHRVGNFFVIGGVMSPVHNSYGKKDLVDASHRCAMLKVALKSSDWIKVSDWESKQENWSRTRTVLEYHQNTLNSLTSNGDIEEEYTSWLPDNIYKFLNKNVQIKLLCGGDLLESFLTPGLWKNDDIEALIGNHGLVVISRQGSDPLKTVYESDLLTKLIRNIDIVTEWISNEISSTKIRTAIRRSESIKYLVPEDVIDYIQQYNLYGSNDNSKFNLIGNYLSYLQSDHLTHNLPVTTNYKCISCKNQFVSTYIPIDVVDSNNQRNQINMNRPHPGQAVKIISEKSPDILSTVAAKKGKEVSSTGMLPIDSKRKITLSKSVAEIKQASDPKQQIKCCKSNNELNATNHMRDESTIKFILTEHGIQVISDIETIV